MSTPITELPDGSGCFTATIFSNEEVMALPIKKRPLNHRISSEIYHAVFESIGNASTTWNTGVGNKVFDSEAASKIAVDLCFKIANEAEKWRELSATEVCAGNIAIAEYVASLEKQLKAMREAIKEAHEAFDEIASGAACLPGYSIAEASTLAQAALAKLQPFLP